MAATRHGTLGRPVWTISRRAGSLRAAVAAVLHWFGGGERLRRGLVGHQQASNDCQLLRAVAEHAAGLPKDANLRGITSAAISSIRRTIRDGKYPVGDLLEKMLRKLTRSKVNISTARLLF